MEMQPHLQHNDILLRPLLNDDYEALCLAASDIEIWRQHPNPLRYQRAHFDIYFEGALISKGALVIIDQATNLIIGATRFYDYEPLASAVTIGYTFLKTNYWGGKMNPMCKSLLLHHAFQFVEKVYFHVGEKNVRSQKAMERIGAIKVKEIDIAYYGEATQTNFVYVIEKHNFNLKT
jgi:RimJ/RimL family protein N-acetyltransferase